MLLITCCFIVFIRRSFLFLWVLMSYFIVTHLGSYIYLFSIPVVMESPVIDWSAVDIRETVQIYKAIVPY